MDLSKEQQCELVGIKAMAENPKHISEAVSWIVDKSELNTCDSCHILDWSDDLHWWEYEKESIQKFWSQHFSEYDALCDECFVQNS